MSPRSNLLGGGAFFPAGTHIPFYRRLVGVLASVTQNRVGTYHATSCPLFKARQGKARQGKARPALTPYQNFAKFIPRFGGVRLAMKISRYLQFGWPESLRNSSKSCESFAFRTPSRFCSPRTTGKAKKKPGRGAWFTLLEVQPRTSVLAVLVGPRLWVCEGWVCDPLSTNW